MFSTVNFATIKGLEPQFPTLGRIKIGMLGEEKTSRAGNKYRMPVKLDHFRVTMRVRDTDGQFQLDEEVHKIVGEKPTELSVTLLYDDPTLNCPARLNCYVGTKRWCHGNGERALRMDAQGLYRERECPCPLLLAPELAEENKGKGPNDQLKCKPNGSLGVQLPYKKSSIGIYRFRTTSVESIQSILTVQGAVLMRTGGVLGGIPMCLRIYPATDNTPGGASRSWKVTLDLPPGGWEEIDDAAREIVKARATSRLSMKAIEAQTRRQLKALVENTEEAAAIIDELFPKPLVVINGVEVLTEEEEEHTEHAAGGNGNAQGAGASAETTAPVVEHPKSDPGAVVQAAAATRPPLPSMPATSAPASDLPPSKSRDDPNLADEAKFVEAYEQEGQADTQAVREQMVTHQIDALRRLLKRKGYIPTATSWVRDGKPLTEPVEDFGRTKRKAFCAYLLSLPDAVKESPQTEMAWEKSGQF